MSLRFKIFMWIGGLFFLGFVVSQFLEERMTSKSLIEEEASLKKQILEQDEIRRKNIERYVRNSLDQEKEKITVLFSKIQNYPWLYARYAPSIYNAENGTWLAAASLMDTNKWIDFIQNTNEGLLASQLVIDDGLTKEAIFLPINKDFGCIVTRDFGSKNFDGPYVAIPYDYEEVTYTADEYARVTSLSPNRDNGYYLLFEPKQLMNISTEDLQKNFLNLEASWKSQGITFTPSSNMYQMMDEMIQTLIKAQAFFTTQPKVLDQITLSEKNSWINQAIKVNGINCELEKANSFDQEIFIRQSRRFDQIVNIWELTTLLSTKIFGKEPFNPYFPKGIAQIPNKKNCGDAFFNQEFLFDQMNISTRKYQGKIGNLDDLSIVVYKDQRDRLFFGGVLTMTFVEANQDVRRGTLTIAIDAKTIVRNLSLASNADTLFVSGGKVLEGFYGNGDIMDVDQMNLPMEQILNQNSGFFNWQGVEYFYLLLRPYSDVDMNFLILSPKNKEFALVTVLNDTAKNLIDKISDQMHGIVFLSLAIVLIALNNIVKHIAYPISLLASACEQLGTGKLQDVVLPEMKKKHKDEVYTLYHAFKEMIAGLKEKEKVMGVLNKVVSPTIAQEILKGKVHLGGEEKIVTVLFADIRNFTKLTEKMNPVEVINLLNSCMTVVSKVVDEFHGVIDKYVGDEVMALFGAPLQMENAPLKACECALNIHKALSKWNQEREAQNLPKVEMGIGIHTGLVVAGNMGAEDRLNYTVLGANVNLGARICSAAKANEVLVSINTIQSPEILDHFAIEPMPPQDLKGFSETISLFKILGEKTITK